MKRQPSVTVQHEDLGVVRTAISTAPEVCSDQPVNSVLAGYT
jgi:hypothetical protein